MDVQFRVDLERAHVEDAVPLSNFFDKGYAARTFAEKASKKYAGEYAHVEMTEEWEHEDSEWKYLGVYVNGVSYTTSDERICFNIERGMTYTQAKRYMMYIDGMSMQRIADIENSKNPHKVTKAAIQQSIEQARARLQR